MTARRVIFLPPSTWDTHTIEENPMTDNPAPINRRLTDDERQLLAELTVWVIAEQKGITDEEAGRALEALNNKGGLYMSGDAVDAYVRFSESNKVIVHVTREWLAYWAHTEEELTGDEIRRSMTWHEPEGGQ
ncbi:hypothetical protein ACN27E_23585 [Mycobacterium sp. WMMD1722]|uniref:hypothetical protein n=1 Tax=Mycobacterium sp. WMMD1722 TaxID=3404117 RepID=UPI003BF462D7